ncbi:TIGR04282 family arsenosugar biosynthesis glycosyltransferase [Psychrobacter halodurans]|uniref:TIGR04282 family arsenosugar biosynthesis glycosyltransferase n=1 Tax=Psychrobacter halodurans TaxID=2818439 RepID=A0AAW4IRB5_9GAMM|nr:TIGR04282 family arsenosugar biosynthesis glycosyltransferase [Psychrobacter halodurans]MBO1516226.1 TIGR04282 family arsenosugar biosynthesis glycosyltransferase [Psychrobacter halodurans]
MNQNSSTCIIIFAKFPAAGKAKTRLQPVLGMAGGARMARKLLLHSTRQARATGFTVELCVSPAPSDPCWQTLGLPKSLQWSAQADGDLGLRMLTASTQALKKFEKVLLIGSDCPSLTAAVIQNAAQQLHNSSNKVDSVMIPAFDGGYVLFGFKKIYASLFADIKWSTASVASITQQRIQDLNWSLALLAPLPDIDEPEDLQYLPVGWLDTI